MISSESSLPKPCTLLAAAPGDLVYCLDGRLASPQAEFVSPKQTPRLAPCATCRQIRGSSVLSRTVVFWVVCECGRYNCTTGRTRYTARDEA
jgi:hypothetical protein